MVKANDFFFRRKGKEPFKGICIFFAIHNLFDYISTGSVHFNRIGDNRMCLGLQGKFPSIKHHQMVESRIYEAGCVSWQVSFSFKRQWRCPGTVSKITGRIMAGSTTSFIVAR